MPTDPDVYDHIISTHKPEEAARILAEYCRQKDKKFEEAMLSLAGKEGKT